MTIKHVIAGWLSCGAGFALAIAGAPWPTFWIFLGTLGTAYAFRPEPEPEPEP